MVSTGVLDVDSEEQPADVRILDPDMPGNQLADNMNAVDQDLNFLMQNIDPNLGEADLCLLQSHHLTINLCRYGQAVAQIG